MDHQMIPVMCQVKHDPQTGTYGDCVRACIASLLDLKSEDVPHFMRDDPPNEIFQNRLREFLESKGLGMFWTAFDSSKDFRDLMKYMSETNPNIHYMLVHNNGSCDHAVICKNDQIVHNPAWCGTGIYKPTETQDIWIIGVIARL